MTEHDAREAQTPEAVAQKICEGMSPKGLARFPNAIATALREAANAAHAAGKAEGEAEEREWTRVTDEVEYGGPYLITNNPGARLNDGSMSHVWLARRIFKDGGEFCAFSDERCMQKVYGVTHYKPVSPPGTPDG